ncbi:protein FAR1-RELATED SEQUENCE 6-like isoform X1 [Camellia sinensis]|uniref:protein FAR1-RELATED SEQUENCE 6-like isoform X1 n=1 Tax=Camellia sinensis TaxID=4442 RepID=UPI00103637A8|nr:protein FAR1-RELATED SEQUENCE 6-like isoform X1 [Camellia sinensis]
MEEEVASVCSSVEVDGDIIEIEMNKGSVELNEANIENEMGEMENAEDNVEDPKLGMEFNSIDEIYNYYRRYAKQNGFSVSKRTCKKGDDGKTKYVSVSCNRAGKPRIRPSNSIRLRKQTKTGCKAGLNAVLRPNDRWVLNSFVLDHNHELSPGKCKFYKCNKILQPHVKGRLELNDGIDSGMNKNSNSIVREAGGHENMPILEKDCKKFVKKTGHLRLGEGDATAMHDYFLKMQVDNSDFFYAMDFNEKGRLRNVFWADARSRAAFKEFGDVVTFDTTCLVNKYDLPFAHFVGVNHHGQLMLLGCALISHEDTETFTWLFQSWLACMYRCSPIAIITDHDIAMKKAIEIVFPNARHRWCLWHIMKKLSEKLSGYEQYESMQLCMQKVVYDSLTKEEFEENWAKFIENHQLKTNEWLLGLYDERHRWVPAFVKDLFWAGMSAIQQSESMPTFFDEFINSKTTLKQFLEQYDNALAKKVENENSEEFKSFNSYIPCITHYELEKQFQSAYTMAKFEEFQQELIGKIYCYLSSRKEGGGFVEYEVEQDVSFEESLQRAIFNVSFKEETSEANCTCRLFEFKGIPCRHQIMVFLQRGIHRIPNKYILKRWNKNVKRRHTKVRICYDNSSLKLEARRYDKMCNAFYEVADLAADFEYRCEKVMAHLHELKEDFKEVEVVSGSNKHVSMVTHNESTSQGDGIVISKGSTNILDPLTVRQKGRPPCKRKQSKVEKVIKEKKEGKKKLKTTTTEGNIEKNNNDDGNLHGTTSTIGFVAPGTQETIHRNKSGMKQSQLVGGISYDLVLPNVIGHPSITAMRPHLGQNNMLQGFGMHPFMGHNHPSPYWRAGQSSFIHMVNAQAKNPRLHENGKSEKS